MRHALPLAALVVALAGCAQQPQPVAAPQARVFAVDMQGGARVCNATQNVALDPARPAEAQMVLVNDGGWCGISVAQPGPRPYAAGLVTARPAHGRVHIRTVGDRTRVDYIPDRGFAGTDSFAVRMLPGGAQMRVAVTVQPGQIAATPAAATGR
ncbi:putative periplasmic lipoprotein [Crenalkalicoccus roseus]|uniref:hypothetical protein n=1 Tax=Crenalkalicoccus roseus TaxID=1485588 RepID=UPI00107FFDE2|nr:hypothetical protein [Crenalkalicoccus roseus]